MNCLSAFEVERTLLLLFAIYKIKQTHLQDYLKCKLEKRDAQVNIEHCFSAEKQCLISIGYGHKDQVNPTNNSS